MCTMVYPKNSAIMKILAALVAKVFSEQCNDHELAVRCMERCYTTQETCLDLCEDSACQYVEGSLNI